MDTNRKSTEFLMIIVNRAHLCYSDIVSVTKVVIKTIIHRDCRISAKTETSDENLISKSLCTTILKS